jgi:hypothetical protein
VSYDVDIGGESFNYTYNVSKLFYDHIPTQRDRGGLSEIHGLTGKQAASVIGEAFVRLAATRNKHWELNAVGEPKFCAEYDAPNGWGSAVGAILFLGCIMAACQANPRCKVRVS